MFRRGKKKRKEQNANKMSKEKGGGGGGSGGSDSDSDAVSVNASPSSSPTSSSSRSSSSSSMKAVRATFQAGSLGLRFREPDGGASGGIVDLVNEGSQAESQNLKAGFRILTVAGTECTQVHVSEIYELIKKASRPFVCTFEPDAGEATAAPGEEGEGIDLFSMVGLDDDAGPKAPSTPTANGISSSPGDSGVQSTKKKAKNKMASSSLDGDAKDDGDTKDDGDNNDDGDAGGDAGPDPRQKRLFASERKVYTSLDRKTREKEKRQAESDPTQSRRRKMISNNTDVVETNMSPRILELAQRIEALATELRHKPRDPVLEPQHKRAYQLHSKLQALNEKRKNWGKLNEQGGSTKFYSINLHMQRLTSLKLFPKDGECPFIGKKAKIDSAGANWSCVHVDASVNSITKIKNIAHFTNLRALNLSNNHISIIGDALSTLVQLRELNLSNNAIVRLEGITTCKKLSVVNLHGNKIPKMENLRGLASLTSLDLAGNEIMRVESLVGLPDLTHLDLSRNSIVNAEELAFCPSLTTVFIGQNNVDNLVEIGRSLVGLVKLTELKMAGNPVCDLRDYRLRVLENTSIRMLDDVEIKPRLRTYLAEMERRAELEDIMEATTQDYMDSISLEREAKNDNMEVLRQSQLELEDAFGKYRSEMENELQECISYIHSLDVRDDLEERSRLTTEQGMSEYKKKLSDAKERRDRARRAFIRKQQTRMLQQTAHTSEAIKYTDKLKELAGSRPSIWRDMKRREFAQRTLEQDADMRDLKVMRANRKAQYDSNKEVREDREHEMLEAVDSIVPQVEAWWKPDAETMDVTEIMEHRRDLKHRGDSKRRGSTFMEESMRGMESGNESEISLADSEASMGSTASKRSNEGGGKGKGGKGGMGSKGKGGGAKKKAAVKKKKGKKVGSDVDESRRKKGLRYRAKFGPGPMGIKLNDRQDGATGGVFVKGLVEGGRGAQHGKIEAGHLLISVNGQDVTKYKLAQVLMKIKDSDRPVTLEFETVPKSNAGATIGDFHGNVYNTLFEQGPIGISFHEETRDEGGGAVVREIQENSQAARHKPPVKVGDVLVSVAGEDVTRLNMQAITKRIGKARRPVRMEFESGEAADLLSAAAFDEADFEDSDDEETKDGGGNKGKKKTGGAAASKGLHDLVKAKKTAKSAKKGFFGRMWGGKKSSGKVAPANVSKS